MSQDGKNSSQESFVDYWSRIDGTDSFSAIGMDPNNQYSMLMADENFTDTLFSDIGSLDQVLNLPMKEEPLSYIAQDEDVGAAAILDDDLQNESSSATDHQTHHQMEVLHGPSMYNGGPDDRLVIQMPDSTQGNMIPSYTNYPGPYGFNIVFQEQPEKLTKSTSYTYSDRLDKLFINMGANCIVSFRVENMPPEGCQIRALPIFEKAEHVREVVKRCPTHSLPEDASNHSHKSSEHLVRCDNDLATHTVDSRSGRFSVFVPFVPPQAGTEHTQYLYKFMCYGSCVGGLNRRPLMLIFTLEKDGEVLGRRALRVRICACPGRDRKGEEKQLDGGGTAFSRKIAGTHASDTETCGRPAKRVKCGGGSGSDEELYTITVKGRKLFEMATTYINMLELLEMVPEDVKSRFYKQKADQLKRSDPLDSLAAAAAGLPLLQVNSSYHRTARIGFPSKPETGSSSNKVNTLSGQSLADSGGGKIASNGLQIKPEKFHTILKWLESINMLAYADMFEKKGYVLMSQLDDFTEENLRDLYIGEAIQKLIWIALTRYRNRKTVTFAKKPAAAGHR